MDVQFVAPELSKLDQLISSEVLLASCFEDERPLQGVAGLVDWRLCGVVSSMLQQKRFSAIEAEVLLVPGGTRFSFDRIIIVGLGPSHKFNEARFREALKSGLQAADKLRARDIAIELPGRSLGFLNPERSLELFFETSAYYDDRKIIIVDDAASHKNMASVASLEQRRRKLSEVAFA